MNISSFQTPLLSPVWLYLRLLRYVRIPIDDTLPNNPEKLIDALKVVDGYSFFGAASSNNERLHQWSRF